jgi:hypothetical protein
LTRRCRPLARGVGVAAGIGVRVLVAVTLDVGDAEGVRIGTDIGVAVPVLIAVAVRVGTAVLGGVLVIVGRAVALGTGVLVAVGLAPGVTVGATAPLHGDTTQARKLATIVALPLNSPALSAGLVAVCEVPTGWPL